MSSPLIIALDFDNPAEALDLVRRIGPSADFYKVGMELYAAAGMQVVRQLEAMSKKVFLDLKLYDIPETIKRATRQILRTEAVHFLTVHGSAPVMRAAVEAKGASRAKLLAVTVLTSFDEEDLTDLGYGVPVSQLVELRVQKATASEIDGIVCSPLEVRSVRGMAGPGMTLVTPGVRSAGAPLGDQKRTATPAEALQDGADYLVIGRQVTRAPDPERAVEQILCEIAAGATAGFRNGRS